MMVLIMVKIMFYSWGKAGYDLALYKNTGEGDISQENLSVIIINPSIVISSKVVQTLDPEYLFSIQRELY